MSDDKRETPKKDVDDAMKDIAAREPGRTRLVYNKRTKTIDKETNPVYTRSRDKRETPRVVECTRENPWDGTRVEGQRVRHHEAHEVGDQEDGWPGGDIVKVHCPVCGETWREELPQ